MSYLVFFIYNYILQPVIRNFFAIPENVAAKIDSMSQYSVPDVSIEELQRELKVIENNYLKVKVLIYNRWREHNFFYVGENFSPLVRKGVITSIRVRTSL